jgi:flagellum-specific peptidoglycan hydrolase FlgJ
MLLEYNAYAVFTLRLIKREPMGAFPQNVIDAAVASNKKWRVPASVTLAQWALESSFGSSMPAGSNNPFGIKAVQGQPFVLAKTQENVNGRFVTVEAKFRKFTSVAAAFDAHGQLLATSTYYVKARMFSADPNGFADALTGIYATDPHYGTKLKAMMKANNLYQYDSMPWNTAPLA